MADDPRIARLESFKALLHEWDRRGPVQPKARPRSDLRTAINHEKAWVQQEVVKARSFVTVTIGPPPAIGGLVVTGTNPFDAIFDPPYGYNLVPTVLDMVDRTIGVLRDLPLATLPHDGAEVKVEQVPTSRAISPTTRRRDHITSWTRRVRTNPLTAAVILGFVILTATGQVAEAVRKIASLFERPTQTPTRIASDPPEISLRELADLKVGAVRLMSRANQPFRIYRSEVDSLLVRLDKICEVAKGWNRQEISGQVCAIVADTSRYLLGGFLRRWKERGTLSPAFIAEAKDLVALAFDEVIRAEGGR